jgi:hypothetical protein
VGEEKRTIGSFPTELDKHVHRLSKSGDGGPLDLEVDLPVRTMVDDSVGKNDLESRRTGEEQISQSNQQS